jgi:SAM-dependent methyltransferase
MNKKEHWENVFSNKQQKEVSWYQGIPKSSIDFFESNNVPLDARIIDVGSGDSYFIDYLVEKGYQHIYALDISEHALNRLKKRLGKRAETIHLVVSDVLNFKADVKFDYWHDRAAFHFLSDNSDIDKYIEITNSYINVSGKLMIATFSESGPLKCSGLNVRQYSRSELEQKFISGFEKIKCVNEEHQTPFDTKQDFTFCSFVKK